MRSILIILASIPTVVLVQAQDRPVTGQITVPAPIRLTMPAPAASTNGSPQRVFASERNGPKVKGPGRLSAQRLAVAGSRAEAAAGLAIVETNGLHRAGWTEGAVTKSGSRPTIKAEPLILQGGNLLEATKSAQQRSREK